MFLHLGNSLKSLSSLSLEGLKYEIVPQRKVCVIVALVIFAILAGVGAALFLQGKWLKLLS